jgi:hypothetical protein
MKNYGKLTIELNNIPYDEFDSLAEASATGGWIRDHSKDEDMKRYGSRETWFMFTLCNHPTLPPASLFITQKHSSDKLYVPNILPIAQDRLNYDEYNQIMHSFAESVLKPLKDQNKIGYNLSGTDTDLSEQLPSEIFGRLLQFSRAANKNTGSTHPLDQERWMGFLVACAQTHIELDSQMLARWFVEVEGWDVEQASRLAEEYEFGRELLHQYQQAS